MTTENAIAQIEYLADVLAATDDNRYDDMVQALEMAKDALKAIDKIKFNCYALYRLMEDFK